ncbi:MAG: addiction module antitoxin [Longimicrobiales bacterium]
MQKKLTITIDESVYRGLYARIGAGRISSFIEELVRPHVLAKEMDDAYAAMARDPTREAEAMEWSEGLIGDAGDDAR